MESLLPRNDMFVKKKYTVLLARVSAQKVTRTEFVSNLIYKYKRPLDSYVCPDWVEKKQTKLIDILSCAKKLFKTEVILWENARCVI